MKASETLSPASTILYQSPPALTCAWPSTVSIAVTRAGALTRLTRHSAAWRGAGASQQAQGETERRMHGKSYNAARRSRSALPTTLTDDSAIAAAAMIGDSSRPNSG